MKGVTRTGNQGGPVLVFLHGGVINRFMWGPVTRHLEDTYDCVALDLPGHGDLANEKFTVDGSVEWVSKVMDELDITTGTLVGLSLGGYIAQAFAATYPDRVTGLVISGATIRYMGWDNISTRFYGVLFPLLSRPAMKAFAKKMTTDLGEEIARPILDCGLSARGGAQALRRLPGTDYAARLAGFDRPVLIANGERDIDNIAGEEWFVSLLPQTERTIIEDAGHACALQQPKAFANAIHH